MFRDSNVNQTKLFSKGVPYVCIPVGVMSALGGLMFHWTHTIEIALSTKISDKPLYRSYFLTFTSPLFYGWLKLICGQLLLSWPCIVTSSVLTLGTTMPMTTTAPGLCGKGNQGHRTHSNTHLKWHNWPWHNWVT